MSHAGMPLKAAEASGPSPIRSRFSGGPEASRHDPLTGIREIAQFIGSGAEKLFTYSHLPPVDPLAVVIICSPLHAEFMRNYRREVLVGRALAIRGVAVMRFHYHGFGNSGGDPTDTTFDSMRRDALGLAGRFLEQTGAPQVGFFGSRFGALIGASAAREYPGSPLALWDPILHGEPYFGGLFRAWRMRALKDGRDVSGELSRLDDVLAQGGTIDILGYSIHSSLYLTSRDRRLAEELGSSTRQIHVVKMGSDPRMHRELPDTVELWRSSGVEVDLHSVGRQEPWWFSAGQFSGQEALTKPVEATVSWLSHALTDPGS